MESQKLCWWTWNCSLSGVEFRKASMSKDISTETGQLGSDEGQLALQDVMQCCSYGFATILYVHRFLLKE